LVKKVDEPEATLLSTVSQMLLPAAPCPPDLGDKQVGQYEHQPDVITTTHRPLALPWWPQASRLVQMS